jgi:hypothetical protein
VLTAQEEKLAELSAILDKKAEGGNTEEAYNEGFEDGKKAEYDAFWDAIQENGTKTDYRFAFAGRAWQNNFRPKYSICPIDAGYLFAYWNKGTLDLVSLSEELGIEIDFSQVTNFESVFNSNSVITRIGVIDARKSSNINNTFSYCSMLHTIEKLILKDDGTTAFTASAFRNCSALVNLTVEGVIGQNGLDLNWSGKLSHDSLMSIINALKDYSGSGTTHTVTLGATNLAKLTDAEKLIATQKGWTLA